MTTNKPTVIAWAPSLDLAKLSLNGGGRNGVGCILTDGPTPHGNDAAMVRLADYEALQAECDQLTRYYKNGIDCFANPCERHSGERTPPFSEFFERYGGQCLICVVDNNKALQAECEKLRKELVESEARGAALSAGACHGGYGDDYGNHRCHYQNRINHLLALLRHSHPIIKAHAGASHMLEGFRPKRNQWDELLEGIDAAISRR